MEPPEDHIWIETYGQRVYPHCLDCSWTPLEGMIRYREIHGFEEAMCIRCKGNLFQLETKPSDDFEIVSVCWICSEAGPQPNDAYFKVAGGCHEKCWEHFEKTGKIIQG